MPADPPPPSGPSSRSAPEAAGWGRPPAGPTPTRRRRRPPFAARNAVLARLLGDPTEEARLLWLRRLDEWARTEGVPALRPTGSSTASRGSTARRWPCSATRARAARTQNAVAPVLLAAAGDTDLAVACGDIGAPAGGLRTYEERLLAPYADYPAPIYGVPGPADWHDGLAGFMTVFCDAPPDARAPLPAATGPRVGAGGAPHVLAAVADRHRRGARRRPLVPRHRRPVRGPARPVLRGRRRAAAARAGRHRADRPGGPCPGPLAAGGVRRTTGRRSCSPPGRCSPARGCTGSRSTTAVPDPTSTRSSPTPRTATSPRSVAATTTTSATPCACATAGPCSTSSPAPRARRCRPPTASRTSTGSPRRCSRTASAATRCAATRWPGSAGSTAGCSASAASRSGRTTRRRSWPSGSATAPRARRRRPRTSRPGPGAPRARSTPCPRPARCCPATRRPP